MFLGAHGGKLTQWSRDFSLFGILFSWKLMIPLFYFYVSISI